MKLYLEILKNENNTVIREQKLEISSKEHHFENTECNFKEQFKNLLFDIYVL